MQQTERSPSVAFAISGSPHAGTGRSTRRLNHPPVHSLCRRLYVTARNKGACKALWCRPSDSSRRRRSSLHDSAPVIRFHTSNTDSTVIGLTSGLKPTGEPKYGQNDLKSLPKNAAEAEALSIALMEHEEIPPSDGRWRGSRKPLFISTPLIPGALETPWAATWQSKARHPGLNVDTNEPTAGSVNVNIAVVARCRPLLSREKQRGVRAAVFCEGDHVVVSGQELPTKRSRKFGFDRVFGESCHFCFCSIVMATVIALDFCARNSVCRSIRQAWPMTDFSVVSAGVQKQ